MGQAVSRVSRATTPSENAYRTNCTTMVGSIFGAGVVDVDSLRKAFAALRAEHPTLAGFIERGAEGYDLVLPSDPGPGSVRVHDTGPVRPPIGREAVVDCEIELSAVDLAVGSGRFCLSLLVYHGICDGYAGLAVIFPRLLEHYASAVSTGRTIVATPQPMLESCETLLARRGVRATETVFGLVEMLRSAPVLPVTEPLDEECPRQVRLQFTEKETARLRAIGKARGASMSAVMIGVVVSAMYELMGEPGELVVPVVSVVAIRNLLNPPVRPAEGTVMLGMGGDMVVVTSANDPLELGRQVLGRLVQELNDGVVQESYLHFPQILGEFAPPPSEMGPVSKFLVGMSNLGVVHEYQSPPGLIFEDFQAVSANLSAHDLGRPELGFATRHNYWFLAFTYKGRLSLTFKVKDAGATPDHELSLVRALRAATGRILGREVAYATDR